MSIPLITIGRSSLILEISKPINIFYIFLSSRDTATAKMRWFVLRYAIAYLILGSQVM